MAKTIKYLTGEEFKPIIDMYQKNVSLREIEKRTGYNRQEIALKLENLGIKTSKGNHYRKYFFDFDYFEEINTEQKAYWLGLFYADGTIIDKSPYGEKDVKIQLAEKDIELLEKFKEDIKSTYPLRYDISANKKNPLHQKMVIMSLRSSRAANHLENKGCVPRKTLTLTFPTEEQVPKDLIYHFIRGYFDGDGSIYKMKTYEGYGIGITGTENFIRSLSKYFSYGSVIKDKRKVNSWNFSIGGTHSIKHFYNLVYKDATRYMKRKYDIFQEFLQIYNNKYRETEGIKVRL